MNNWLQTLLFWALWWPAMALVMWAVAKARLRAPKNVIPGMIRHSWALLALGVSGCLLFGGMAAVVLLIDPTEFHGRRQQLVIAAGFGGFALLCAIPLLEYEVVRHQLVEGGLRYQPLFRRRGVLAWSAVRRVRYSETNKWFRLDGEDGQVARISAMMIGLPEFARALLQNIPGEKIDPATLPVLIATAEGNPPRLW